MEPTSDSYVKAFPEFTKLKLTPEISFFLEKAGLQTFPITLDNCMEMFQTNRLYNLEIVGDIIIELEPETYTKAFTNKQMGSYLRYVMIEEGLGGLFQYRTPREYIEGFIDPTVW